MTNSFRFFHWAGAYLCWHTICVALSRRCLRIPTRFSEDFMGTILLLILILLLLGAVPAWPYSRNWGYAPGSGVGLILVVVLVLVLMGRI